MNNTFNKIKIILTKPKVVMIAGRGKETSAQAISRVLQRSFRLGKEIMIYQVDSKKLNEAQFLLKKARSVVLVVTHFGEYESDKEFFTAEKSETALIEQLVKYLPEQARLVLNFDDETVRDIKNQTNIRALNFGFGARAEIQSSDVVLTQLPDPGTNFKINYEGNIVPVWLKNLFGKEHIYAALSAVAVGEILGLNLVEISDALKSYQGMPGRLKLVEGIKGALILDDSESAKPLSMAEALGILKGLEISGRKIAVLGDIINLSSNALEAHESIGELVKGSADILFTIGPRAKFYAEGAKKKGFDPNKIFSFNEAAEAGLALQKEMKQGDLILIDGSGEIQMVKIVEEIKYI